jgi:hypothetical protein
VDALTKEVQRIQYDMAYFKVKNERLEKVLEALVIRQLEQESGTASFETGEIGERINGLINRLLFPCSNNPVMTEAAQGLLRVQQPS